MANALAAAAAADALGFSARRIAAGLRSFTLDTGANPGRLNLYERRGRLVLIDFAHNEAGLQGLLDVSDQLVTRSGGRRGKVRLALGTAGDRTDEILRNLGRLAGARADDVVICEKRHYLRGRDLRAMNRILRAGVKEGGFTGKVEAHPSELTALQALEKRAGRGDVVAVMTHVERTEIADWLKSPATGRCRLSRLRELLARGLGLDLDPVVAAEGGDRRDGAARGAVLAALQLLPHVVGVVDADHDHVAVAPQVEGAPGRLQLVQHRLDLLDPAAIGHLGPHALLDQGRRLAAGPAAVVRVLAQDQRVEVARRGAARAPRCPRRAGRRRWP